MILIDISMTHKGALSIFFYLKAHVHVKHLNLARSILHIFSSLNSARVREWQLQEDSGQPHHLLTPLRPPTRDPWWWTLVKRHCSIEPASALHFNELMGEHGQLRTRHLLNGEKAEENSFHASWLLKKPYLRRLRHMYVINSKCTLISLKEPHEVFSLPIKAFHFELGRPAYVSLFMWEIKLWI